MYQITFWALTLGCLIGGFMATMNWFGGKIPILNQIYQILTPFQTLIGFITLIGGVLALFYPTGPEMFTGDLIPAVIAILLGFCIGIGYMKTKPEFLNYLYNMIKPFQVPLGSLAIAAAIVHWFFMGTEPFF